MSRTMWIQFYKQQYLIITGQQAYHAVKLQGQGWARRTDYRILAEEYKIAGTFYYWYFRSTTRLPHRHDGGTEHAVHQSF